MTAKMIEALARHERAVQAVDEIRKQIGDALGQCPAEREVERRMREWKPIGDLYDEKGRTKTHLWHAFRVREPSSCGYGSVGLGDDGIDDALSPGSEFECEHCLHAWRLIIARKKARQDLGAARRLIRYYGKKAMAMQGGAA